MPLYKKTPVFSLFDVKLTTLFSQFSAEVLFLPTEKKNPSFLPLSCLSSLQEEGEEMILKAPESGFRLSPKYNFLKNWKMLGVLVLVEN